MKTHLIASLLAASAFLAVSLPNQAHAQSEASALSAISALPLASVVVGGSAVVAVPVILSAAGATLVVRFVEVSARGTVFILERASDGARVSLEISGAGLAAASLATGSIVTTSIIGAGIVLSAAGEAIAFLPNELGRALLSNERLTY
jgi:hypothetical protein